MCITRSKRGHIISARVHEREWPVSSAWSALEDMLKVPDKTLEEERTPGHSYSEQSWKEPHKCIDRPEQTRWIFP